MRRVCKPWVWYYHCPIKLLHLAPGKSVADMTGYFATPPTGPPPLAAAGGLIALSPGQRGIAVLDLAPGAYAAICFLPDAASGKEHLQLGMIAGLTVMDSAV